MTSLLSLPALARDLISALIKMLAINSVFFPILLEAENEKPHLRFETEALSAILESQISQAIIFSENKDVYVAGCQMIIETTSNAAANCTTPNLSVENSLYINLKEVNDIKLSEGGGNTHISFMFDASTSTHLKEAIRIRRGSAATERTQATGKFSNTASQKAVNYLDAQRVSSRKIYKQCNGLLDFSIASPFESVVIISGPKSPQIIRNLREIRALCEAT